MRLLKERADKANARTTASVRELARVKDQLQVGQAAEAGLQHDMAALAERFAHLDLTRLFRQPLACVLHHLQQQKPDASHCKQAIRRHQVGRDQTHSPHTPLPPLLSCSCCMRGAASTLGGCAPSCCSQTRSDPPWNLTFRQPSIS